MSGIKSIILMTVLTLTAVFSQNLNPYILISEVELGIIEIADAVKSNLEQNDFQLLGEYRPAKDQNRYVIIFTAEELIAAVQEIGGLSGFAAALRIGITSDGNTTRVSCVNPIYLGNAYFQKNYQKVEDYYLKLDARLKNALPGKWTEFGTKEGLSTGKLQKYHYMFGMEYFEDVVELNTLESFTKAVSTVETNEDLSENVELVYSIEIPGEELKLFGVALSGSTGEEHFLPIIDISTPRHTAFLPYEILVDGSQVVMLHGRYRIALSFPDLTMMTFGKIMSTPGDIEDLLKQLAQ